MEGETVLIALAGAALAAFVITRFGARQPSEHRPRHSGQESETDDTAATKGQRHRRALTRPGRRSDADDAARPRRRVGARGNDAPVDADLLRTLEELAAHPQNRAAAVDLLRQRTAMSARHARRFINAL